MKIIWKGFIDSEAQFPVADLPENAVAFNEPQSMSELMIKGLIFLIPLFIFCFSFLIIKKRIYGTVKLNPAFVPIGVILGLIALLPHELLHAVVYPKGATVEVGIILKQMTAFAVSTAPLSKLQFVIMSILPSLILGVIPLIAFLFVPPEHRIISTILFIFGLMGMLCSYADYLNAFNAITQMPKGSLTQLSGVLSYWFIP